MPTALDNARTGLLVLGGTGMLGHKLAQRAATRLAVSATVRRNVPTPVREALAPVRFIEGLDATDPSGIDAILDSLSPAVVVNCIGTVKQRVTATTATQIAVNALFPHRVADACRSRNTRFIHLSTDCVFSGADGAYGEAAVPDSRDLYGMTKLLGEVRAPGCLTIRTSMIGRELHGVQGLLEWFLSQEGGRVNGFAGAVFSGLTTVALADLLLCVVLEHPELDGLYHVAAAPLSKLSLLRRVRDALGMSVEIVEDESVVCDRSLDGSRFRAATGIAVPSWDDMIQGLVSDSTPYQQLRASW